MQPAIPIRLHCSDNRTLEWPYAALSPRTSATSTVLTPCLSPHAVVRVLALGSLPAFMVRKLAYGWRCDDRRRRIQGFVRCARRVREWIAKGGPPDLLVGLGERALTRATTLYRGEELTRVLAEAPRTERPDDAAARVWLRAWARSSR